MKRFDRLNVILELAIILINITTITVAILKYSSAVPVSAKENVMSTEFSIPTRESYPRDITTGSDGNIWFTESGSGKIGRITPEGKITEFPLIINNPENSPAPFEITTGSDGNIWFTDNANKIGRITPSGVITEFLIPTDNSAPYGITVGNDSSLWFTESNIPSKIGRITTNGIITEFPLLIDGNIGNIASGSDGNLWVINTSYGSILRITPMGEIAEFKLPYSDETVVLNDIISGPDGNIWFTENIITANAVNKIGRITPEGTITEFPLPASINDNIRVASLTIGSDGNIWYMKYGFYETDESKIGRITPDGSITEFQLSTVIYDGLSMGLVTGSDGNIWFTDLIGNKIGRMNLANLPVETITPKPNVKTPVIFIPGIMGSELAANEKIDKISSDCGAWKYNKGEKVWLNLNEAVLSTCDDYFDVLKLQPDGQTELYSQIGLNNSILEKVELLGVKRNFYEDTISFFLKEKKYQMDKDFFVFPYDWRKDISLTTSELNTKINSVLDKTGAEKVHIVAHSMGGLVAREYIRDPQQAGKVDTLVELGTPLAGSPITIAHLLYGTCPNEFKVILCILNENEIKDLTQNFTGVYDLIPSQKYYELYPELYPFNDGRNMDNDITTEGVLGYDQLRKLLANMGKNMTAFNKAESLHNTLDSSYTNTNGVKIYSIVGSGFPTIGQIIDYVSGDTGLIKQDAIATNGDDTVSTKSATLDKSENVYYVNQKHGDLFRGSALTMAYNLLNGATNLIEGVLREPFPFDGGIISVHSPTELHAYDDQGNHTGPTNNGLFEENIHNSTYTRLGDSKFIYLTKGGNYRITTIATGEGNFDLKWKIYEKNTLKKEQLYLNVSQTKQTTTSMNLDAEIPLLEIDSNGNGKKDKILPPTRTLTGDALRASSKLIKEEMMKE